MKNGEFPIQNLIPCLNFVAQGVDRDVWKGYDLTVPYAVDIFGYEI